MDEAVKAGPEIGWRKQKERGYFMADAPRKILFAFANIVYHADLEEQLLVLQKTP